MKTFPENITFKYPWRKYQQRVLNELEEHLSNNHLHVVAPPGSGKTVLGLEVALRLNKPTLILAPTIAIRNQWILRFCELFLQTPDTPDWISRDIRNPKFLTVSTYQGIHAACQDSSIPEEEDFEEEDSEIADNGKEDLKNKNIDAVIAGLKAQNIKTIVVDEAHHLKNSWWYTLSLVKKGLDPIIVGLTATPPYDVTGNEWQRYIELNGPVDTEISVPELIIENDLCPHQDYVYFTSPTEKEEQEIADYRERMENLFQELRKDKTIAAAIENHPVWIDPESHLDWIYNNLACYSAILIFLNDNGKQIPEKNFEVIGDKNLEIPKLDYAWLKQLLNFFLYIEKDKFADYEDYKKELEKKLRKYGALERRQINFDDSLKITSNLTSSISKLASIKEITNFEYANLGSSLRMVILTDYIRKEFFSTSPSDATELTKIGIAPIFETLRRDNKVNIKLGVLTGSVVIIPLAAYNAFKQKAAQYGITTINTTPLESDFNYIKIVQNEKLKHDIVHIVTQIFQDGEIEVLIGTKSLLGEGWDAPAINALILASFVGSFVLSNQMRGRAIRTENGNSGKTGNIWHLACVDPTSVYGGNDLELLKRRFRSFVGVSVKDNGGIENGTDRLEIPQLFTIESLAAKNNETLAYAADRNSLKQRWRTALAEGVNLVEEIKIPFPKQKRTYRQIKDLYYNKTIKALTFQLASGITAYGSEVLRVLERMRNIKSVNDLLLLLSVVGVGGFLIFGREMYNSFRLYVSYRDISKDINQIGIALVNTLHKAGFIHTPFTNLKVDTQLNNEGTIFCHLEGGTTYEKSVFINALLEVISPIDNPRYVIIRKNKLLFIKQRDYHSVPEVIAKNKNLAIHFESQWQNHVGDCELIFTRNIEGRKLLLASRVKSLASQFETRAEHVNKWR